MNMVGVNAQVLYLSTAEIPKHEERYLFKNLSLLLMKPCVRFIHRVKIDLFAL
jgi:hypothetical protein